MPVQCTTLQSDMLTVFVPIYHCAANNTLDDDIEYPSELVASLSWEAVIKPDDALGVYAAIMA